MADGGGLKMTAELAGQFGDKRLGERAASVATSWVQGGATSFPKMLGESA